MAKDFTGMEDSNGSSNPDIHQVSDPSRRTVLRLSAVTGKGLPDLVNRVFDTLRELAATACENVQLGRVSGMRQNGRGIEDILPWLPEHRQSVHLRLYIKIKESNAVFRELLLSLDIKRKSVHAVLPPGKEAIILSGKY